MFVRAECDEGPTCSLLGGAVGVLSVADAEVAGSVEVLETLEAIYFAFSEPLDDFDSLGTGLCQVRAGVPFP